MSQEISSIGIRFGDEFQGDGNLNVKVATSELEAAALETQQKFDNLNYSLLLKFENCENAEKLCQLLESLKKEDQQSDEVKLSDQKFYRDMKSLLKSLNFKTQVIGQSVYAQISLKEEVAEKILEPLQILLESGLKDIAQNPNTLQAEVCVDVSADQIFDMLKNFRASVPFLTRSRAKVTLALDKNISTQIEDVVRNIDENLLSSPQLQFLKYFKNLDVDLTFNSADNLPEPIKKVILPGKIKQISEEDKQEYLKHIQSQTFLYDLINLMPPNITGKLFIDEFIFIKATASLKNLKKIIMEYLLNILRKM